MEDSQWGGGRPRLAAAFAVLAVAVIVCGWSTGCWDSAGPSTQPAVTGEGRIVHATDATFEQEVLKSDVPVLVDFCATWCPPCRELAPILEELSTELPGVKFVKVDVDRCPAVWRQYGTGKIPTLLVFKGGQPIGPPQVGFKNKAQLKAMLEQ
jgi:thioredoxin 1